MDYPMLKDGQRPEIGKIYSVLKSELKINSDLRSITNDASLDSLLESIKKNNILIPIEVWHTKNEEGETDIKIITGNRRKYCADKIKKITHILCIFRDCADQADYMRQAYHSNIQKASKINELIKAFKNEVIENGFSPKKIATTYGVSEKSVYAALKISGSEILEEIAKSSFKNAVHMANNKSLISNLKIVQVAKNGTIEELKEILSSERKKIILQRDKADGKTPPPIIRKFETERKKQFFIQLDNYKGKSILAEKLVNYLYGDIDKWN